MVLAMVSPYTYGLITNSSFGVLGAVFWCDRQLVRIGFVPAEDLPIRASSQLRPGASNEHEPRAMKYMKR